MGTAVIERLAIWSPAGEHLEFRRVALKVRHFVALYIVGYQVTFRIEHLNLVGVCHLEHLAGLVRGIDNEFQPWMPGRIDTSRQDGVVPHVDFLNLPVTGNHRSAQVLAGVELHTRRVVLLIVVAVDALSLASTLLAAQDVVVNDALIVVLQTALADGEFLVTHIRWRNEAIAQIGIYAVLRNEDFEWLILRPLSVVAGIYINFDALACGLRNEPLPVVMTWLYLIASAQQLFAIDSKPRHHFFGLLCHFERERCHVHGYCNPLIVGVYVRLLARCRIVLGQLRTTS